MILNHGLMISDRAPMICYHAIITLFLEMPVFLHKKENFNKIQKSLLRQRHSIS
jgi:hypothetical protein